MIIDVVFDGCLGTIHLPQTAQPSHGVILCPAFGYQGLCTHRGFAALAGDLAARGMPSLRFDYPDQGDSIDLPPDADAAAHWIASIASAAALLAQRYPGIAISLVGYRLGALLAANAAPHIPGLNSLVCIAPILSGRSYLRELRLQYGATTSSEADFNAGGWRLSPATIAHLADLSFASCPPDAGVMLISETPSRALGALAETPGREFLWKLAPDIASLDQHAHHMAVPEQSFRAIVAWLAGRPRLVRCCTHPTAVCASLTLPGCNETAVRFGPDAAIFGIANHPITTAPRAPCLLILNTGGNPRSGHGRLSVRLARELARCGVASLRIDVTGTGDTLPNLRGRDVTLYDASLTCNVRAALDWIAAAGWGPAIACGVCSGAYLSWCGALADHRIAGAVLINTQSFLWPEGKDIDAVLDVALRQVDGYRARISDSGFWYRLLRGQVRTRGIVGSIFDHYQMALRATLQSYLPAWLPLSRHALQVWQDFTRLAQRSAHVLLVYSADDPGLNELHAYFGRGARRLLRRGLAQIRYIEDADHTLSSQAAKQRVIQLVKEFVGAHFTENSSVAPKMDHAGLGPAGKKGG